MIQPKCFIIEFAAIVFLIITIPAWLPIALPLLVGGFVIMVILIIIGIVFSTFARSEEITFQFHTILSHTDIIYI